MLKKISMERKCYVRPECLVYCFVDEVQPLAASPTGDYIPIIADEEESVPSDEGQ